MEKFKLSDHAHYERNAPGYPQAVFFDVAPTFHGKIADAISEELDKINEEERDNKEPYGWVTILTRLRSAVETSIGELTFPELLYAVHYISAQLSYQNGRQDGYEVAMDEITANSIKPIGLAKGKTIATT